MTSSTSAIQIMEKRGLDDSSVPTMLTKKQKLEGPEVSTSDATQKVNPSELASAFALASLMSLSPTSSTTYSSRMKEQAELQRTVQNAVSWEETRSPEATQSPTTPDQRSPGSPGAPKTPILMEEEEYVTTPDSSRRVRFAPSTKQQSSGPASILKSSRSVSRRGPLHITQRQGLGAGFVARSRATQFPPVPYGMMPGNAFRTPPHMSRHPMHSPHAAYHLAPQPWFHGPSAALAMTGRMTYPPQRLMQPPLLHPSDNRWVCDYCNVVSFPTYEDTCVHEEACKIRCAASAASRMQRGMPPPSPHHQYAHPGIAANHSLMSRSSSGEDEQSVAASMASASADHWHAGTMSLAMEESDREWLSEIHCFVRSQCVEVFSAREEDVSCASKRGRIAFHQVGIRCRFCTHVPAKDKAVAAVSFPTSIGGIYESVKRWQRVHLEVCEEVPQGIRDQFTILANTNVWVPTTRQYWTDSAKSMGLVDTNDGIRFGIDPREITMRSSSSSESGRKLQMPSRLGMAPANDAMPMSPHHPQSGATYGTAMPQSPMGASLNDREETPGASSTGHVVFVDDMEMIPPYVYYLMRQVEPCRFTEADRFVARSKGPVGYPGFQCSHCNGHAGLGKYFPVSAKSFSTNSTSQNIHAHLLKCRKCPDHVKDQLVLLKIEKGRSPRLEPGWRKIFFDLVWGRLHG